MRTFSLERRLYQSLVRALVIIFLLLWGLTTFALNTYMVAYLEDDIYEDFLLIKNYIVRTETGWQVNYQDLDRMFYDVGSGHYFVVRIGEEIIASPSLGRFLFYMPVVEPGTFYETRGPMQEELLVLYETAELDGETVHVYLAEPYGDMRRTILKVDMLFAGIALLGLLIILWQQRRILRAGFAPLDELRQQVLQSKNRQAHLALPERLPSEIAPLAEALEETLMQLHERMQQLRDANANLSHALKTPLNLLFQHLETMEAADCPQKEALYQQAQRLHALIERELSKVRIAGPMWHQQPFRLPEDLDDLLEAMRQLYPSRQLRCENETTLKTLPFEREDGLELLGNLLDNACKWAQTQVRIALQCKADCLQIVVEDDGPGVPAHLRDELGQRGHRLDEQVLGTGLGLSIVKEIIARYDAELRFDEGQWGGLQVTIRIAASC